MEVEGCVSGVSLYVLGLKGVMEIAWEYKGMWNEQKETK